MVGYGIQPDDDCVLDGFRLGREFPEIIKRAASGVVRDVFEDLAILVVLFLRGVHHFELEVLHFILYFRSWDLWGGFPSNLGGLQLVKQYMAEEIGVDDGEMVAVSKGLHLYEYSWELAKIRTSKPNPVALLGLTTK